MAPVSFSGETTDNPPGIKHSASTSSLPETKRRVRTSSIHKSKSQANIPTSHSTNERRRSSFPSFRTKQGTYKKPERTRKGGEEDHHGSKSKREQGREYEYSSSPTREDRSKLSLHTKKLPVRRARTTRTAPYLSIHPSVLSVLSDLTTLSTSTNSTMTQNKYDRATGNVRLPGQAESVGYLVRGPHAAAPGTETIPAHPQLRSSSSSRSSSATGTNTAIPTPTAILTTSAYRATYRQGTNIGGEDHSSPVHGYGSELYGQFHPLQPFQQAIYAPTSDSNADNQSQYARMQQILDRTPRQHYPKRGPTANGEGESTSGQNSEQRSHGPETGAAPPDNVFRRFMSLHHRLIAQIQSDLVIYESQLAGLEQRIRTYPGPDVGHLQDLQERRRAILAHVFQKLEQYRKAIDLASSNAALESPSPSTELFDNTEYFVIPIRQDPMKDRDMLATHESFDSSSQSSQFDEAKPSHDCPTNTEDEVATTKSEPAPTIGDSEISSAASLSECTQFALACGILIVLCRLLPFALAKLRDRGPALELIICTILPVIFSTISLISLLIGIDKDIRTASRLSRSERMKLAWLVVGAIFSWYSYELYGTLGAFLHLLAVVSAVFAFLLSSNPPCEAELTAATDEPRLPKTVEGDAVGECTKETSSSDAPVASWLPPPEEPR